MKTYVHYMSEFLLELEVFQTEVVEKVKTYVMLDNFFFFSKIVPLWDNEGKCDRAGQGTDNSLIRRMDFICWISKATHTHLEYIVLIAFSRKQWLGERALAFHYTYIAWFVIL